MRTNALTSFVSLLEVDKKGKSTAKKRTCWKCGKYHSTIKAMNSCKRTCDGYEDESDDEDSVEDEDKKNEEDYINVDFIGDGETYEVVYL